MQSQKYSETLRHSVKGIGIIGAINIMQIIGVIGAIIIRQIIVPFWGRCGQAQRRI